MKNINIIGGAGSTKGVEDLALTPFLFWVHVRTDGVKINAIGLHWLYYNVCIGIGINVPKHLRWVLNIQAKNKND